MAHLPERAALLLRRAAMYEEAVPLEGLAFLLGDERDAMPDVSAEVQALLGWSLLAPPPGEDLYQVHTLMRDWARASLEADERQSLLWRAARYWRAAGNVSRDLGDYLRVRHYLFEAGDYEAADEVVQAGLPYLHRWGRIELMLRLRGDSVRTLTGHRRAVALGNLATVYQRLGDYRTARQHSIWGFASWTGTRE